MIPATVHIAASLRRNHFISSACSIILMLFLFPLFGPGGRLYAQGGVYQDDPAHGRSFNRFRAKIILTPPVFTDSAHLPTLPLYYGSTGKRDSTIGSIAYTRTDDQHWRYTATGWQRMTGGLSIVGGDTTILSQTLDSTGQLQGRALFSGAGFKISSSPYYLYSDALRKLVINSTNISHGGNDKRFVVNGRALINDLYLEAETINTGPPSGSTTYPLGWNPSTQQVEKYTEWPGGISYPYTTGKYLNAYGTFAPLISDSVAEGSTNRYFTDARARAAIGLTTTGSSGAATYNSSTGVLNIPAYSIGGLGGVPTSRTITINGTTLDLSADRSWTISGGGGGITGIGSFASTGDAKGLSVSGTDVIMHPATATTPGGVSTGAQTWAGEKSFADVIRTKNAQSNTPSASIYLRDFTGSGARVGIGRGIADMHFFGQAGYGFRWYGGGDFNTAATDWLSLTESALQLGTGVELKLSTPLKTVGAPSNTAQASIYLRDFTGAGNRIGIGRGVADVHFFGINDYGFRWYGGGDFNTGASNWAFLDQNGFALYGANHASAALTVNSTTKGFLPPRMNASQANAIASKAEGLIVYVTDTGGSPFNFTGKGWWGWNGTTWEKLNP